MAIIYIVQAILFWSSCAVACQPMVVTVIIHIAKVTGFEELHLNMLCLFRQQHCRQAVSHSAISS